MCNQINTVPNPQDRQTHAGTIFIIYIYMSKYNTNTNTIYKSTKIMYIKVLVSMMQ